MNNRPDRIDGHSLRPERVSADPFLPDPEATALIPYQLAARFLIMPLAVEGPSIRVAMKDPKDFQALDYIELVSKKRPIPVGMPEARLRELIHRVYGSQAGAGQLEAVAAEATKISNQGADGSELPIVQLVDQILFEAVRVRATDIHLQPEETELLIRLRIDGVLTIISRLPAPLRQPVSTRVKVLAGLDISERRVPQDGKFELAVGEKRIDLRVSTTPTIYGENVVLRVLDRNTVDVGFSELGFADEDQERISTLVRRPHGIFLVTGPTGSGKTTSLYSALRLFDKERLNIMTLEDPVEYRMAGVRQSQISEKAGFGFAKGLRALMRQDPDVILVGEIRDQETAEIAMRASLTGHMVLSTLHTNTALETLARLRDMGVPAFLISTTINGVMAQRLMRRICRYCIATRPATTAEKACLDVPAGEPLTLHFGSGCSECQSQGYRGRFAVFEILEVTDDVRRAIVQGKAVRDIEAELVATGYETLRRNAVRRVIEGWSTVEELVRVLGAAPSVGDNDSALAA
ncbi:MAG: type II/IV secretion system protein [Candidatus Eisenbacteria bacterium]|nr:type II/IV secretion system protein [Candidatus Eisenbacteria bacterium]